MSRLPIPLSALDDRLGIFGTAGSGKTYTAMLLEETILGRGARVGHIDPLGVSWGLRLTADGKSPSPHKIVIFGGKHGDLPINDRAGALIGDAVCAMSESWIIDLSELGTKAAERRFMLPLLETLYRKHGGDPLHVVFDEADMWAPERLLDKEGDAAKLLGMMETLVRRGRVKGFIPWLISQRPAVLSKNVLSQVDGLIAMKLTSSQDRKALGAWIEGQADQEQGRKILAELPTKQRGEAVIWIPGRDILKEAAFPERETFDSSRTPKRGEKAKKTVPLAPVDLDKLKEKLATVEAEAKANDPKALRAELAKVKGEKAALERQMANAVAAKVVEKPVEKIVHVADPKAIAAAEKRGIKFGRAHGAHDAYVEATKLFDAAIDRLKTVQERANERIGVLVAMAEGARQGFEQESKSGSPAAAPVTGGRPAAVTPVRASVAVARTPSSEASGDGTLEAPLRKIIDAIRWWNVLGVAAPNHAQVAFIAGYSHKSGTWSTYLSRLRLFGLIEGRGDLVLTEAGSTAASDPDVPPSGEQLREVVLAKVNGPLARILSPVIEAYPKGLSHADAAERAGYSAQSGTWSTYLSRLRSLDLIAGRGELTASEWLFP